MNGSHKLLNSMSLKKIKFCSLIFFFLLPTNLLIADNYNNTYIVDDLKIEFDQSVNRKFVKNLFKAYVDLNNQSDSKTIFQTIKKEYSKKWFKGYVIYKDKRYKAEIRIFGELKDHINMPVSSVKVKLKEGHISNITRFILFLPNTRNGNKEVLWSLLMNKLSVKSFYTQMVNVNFMSNSYKAIFQEDASKEFLERNNLKETLILKENDYNHFNLINKQGVYPNFFSLVVNNGSFLKNKKSLEIASNAIATFINNKEDKILKKNSFFKIMNNKYAWHGMLSHNRKFIYFPLENSFEEIYYDGSVNYKAFRNDNCEVIKDDKFKIFESDYLKLSNKKLSKIEQCIYSEKIRIYNFYNKNNSLPYKDKFSFVSNFESNKKNLQSVRKNIIDNFLVDNLISKNNKKVITFSFYYKDEYYLVEYDIIEKITGNYRRISYEDYKDSLRGRLSFDYLNEKIPVFNLGNILPKKKIKILDEHKFKTKDIVITKPGTYKINLIENIKYNNIIYFDSSATKIILNGILDYQDSLSFIDINTNKNLNNNLYRYDENLLNGCVNFIKVSFKGGSIHSEGMKCEDSINIVNSTGTINTVTIDRSSFDGLDIDISDITINDLKISNSKNDCLDLSYGNYKVLDITLENCDDKAISVGEKSTLKSDNIIVIKSNYALVSKDSSEVFVNNLISQNNQYCVAAYKKKQEFDGGFIEINSLKCKDYINEINSDRVSKIIINNRN